jgi:hypothetical protein
MIDLAIHFRRHTSTSLSAFALVADAHRQRMPPARRCRGKQPLNQILQSSKARRQDHRGDHHHRHRPDARLRRHSGGFRRLIQIVFGLSIAFARRASSLSASSRSAAGRSSDGRTPAKCRAFRAGPPRADRTDPARRRAALGRHPQRHARRRPRSRSAALARRPRALGDRPFAAVWAAKRDPQFVDVVRRHLRIPGHLGLRARHDEPCRISPQHPPRRLPALGRIGRRGSRPQQGRFVPAHRTLSRTGSRQRRARRTRRSRRPPQQAPCAVSAPAGPFRRGAAPFASGAIRRARFPDAASALVDAERKSGIRRGGSSFRVELFPHLPLSAARRRRGAAEGGSTRADRTTASTPRNAARLRRPHRSGAAACRGLHARMRLAR